MRCCRSSTMPKPRWSPTRAPNSRSSSAQNAWMVPVLTTAAAAPNERASRSAISPAALLVKVKAQSRSGRSPTCSMRKRMRSMRQYVFPAPGPARTSSGATPASIASRCDGEGRCRGASNGGSSAAVRFIGSECTHHHQVDPNSVEADMPHVRRHVVPVITGLLLPALLSAQTFRTEKFSIGGEGGTDYLTADPATGRVYISRATHVMVVDEASGKVIGDIPETPRVHGIALAPRSGHGFTTNG